MYQIWQPHVIMVFSVWSVILRIDFNQYMQSLVKI